MKKRSSPAPRRTAKEKEPLIITGDLPVSGHITGWERELLLPVVVPIVADRYAAFLAAEEAAKTGKPK